MADFKDFSRKRDIAVKRLKRMEEAGTPFNIRIPTVKEIRAEGLDLDKQMLALTHFLEEGPSLSRRREARRIAKRSERTGYPKKYQSYVKGLQTLGVDIPINELPAFFNYLDYRFSQGAVAKQYLMDEFVEDYKQLIKKGYSPETIINDYQKFTADQMKLQHRKQSMEGWSSKKSFDYWKKFSGREDYEKPDRGTKRRKRR